MTASFAPPAVFHRRVLVSLLVILALLLTSAAAAPRATRAADMSSIKVVVIVGPTHSATSSMLTRGKALADRAEEYGMDVRRVFHPNATWDNVLKHIQGANVVGYFGHGNGWPSPYGPFQESTKNGFGLNGVEGGSASSVTYYGANKIRNNVVLADNSVVLFSHLCYAAGNGEEGHPIPTWDVARQRVDNFAAGFLFVGAKGVFALSTGTVVPVLDALVNTPNKTFDDIFMTPGAKPQAYYGFVGWDNRRFDSERMPGFKNHLDRDPDVGFKRALSGKLSTTGADWAGGGGGTEPAAKPVVGAPKATFVAGPKGTSKVTANLAWAPSESVDVVGYDLQYSRDGGAWTTVSLASPTSTSADVQLPANSDYQFRLRARNGTTGDWVVTTSRRLVRLQEKNVSITYAGSSKRVYLSGASGSYVRRSNVADSSATLTFDGTGVALMSARGANRGLAELWLDGEKVATVDLYASSLQSGRVVWASERLQSGTHTLEVRVLGSKSGSSSGYRVDVDAFLIWR